jgi:hypothetical protein
VAGTGCVQAFDGATGVFIGFLPFPPTLTSVFHPRGVVIGPDGFLYVSNVPHPPPPLDTGLGGQILVYDPKEEDGFPFVKVFVDSGDNGNSGSCNNCDFNRPEGLVFGPDGNLYVTSFRANSSDTDKILIFAGPASNNPGTLLTQIVLDQVGLDRAYAQALLFGPGPTSNHVYLFVPITTPTRSSNAGQVRRYDVTDLSNISFDIFVPTSSKQNSPLGSSWYLTFGNTSPVTLDYTP